MTQANPLFEHENFTAQHLIKAHTIGDLRDKADLNNAIYHIHRTLNFTETLIKEFNGSDDDKLEFISKIKKDLEKFNI